MSGLGGVGRGIRRWAYLHQREVRRIRAGVFLVVALCAIGSGLWYLTRSRAPATGLTDVLAAAAPVAPGTAASAPPPSFALRARTARDEGRYDEATALIAQGLAADAKDRDLLAMRGEFNQDLTVDFDFYYLRGQRMPIVRGGGGEVALAPEDAYYLSVQTAAPAYLYLFQVTSDGEVKVFCPNARYVPNRNPVPPGKYRIPDGYGYLHVAPTAGQERLLLVATRWRHTELERLASGVATQDDPVARQQLVNALTARMALEERATDRLPGLTIGSYAFRNLGGGGAGR